MRISQIYSNRPKVFPPIPFNTGLRSHGLNVIMGEVRRPQDASKDSHNLGKTTLIDLIDFLLLKKVSEGTHFLVDESEVFSGFQFFLEIVLNSESFVTVRRGVDDPSRVFLARHKSGNQNLVKLDELKWDHMNVPIDRARKLLDSYLDLKVVAPWTYRKGVTYFLRTQRDYADCFQIAKFSRGTDSQWKPYLAHVFGFDAQHVSEKYELEKILDEKRAEIERKKSEVQISDEDYTKFRSRIESRRADLLHVEEQLDRFSFAQEESRIGLEVVREVEQEVAEVNNQIYNTEYDVAKLESSLATKVKFNLKDIERVFSESEVYLGDQLTRSYDELLTFNRSLSRDRKRSIRLRLQSLGERLEELRIEATRLDQKRESLLKVLRDAETFRKYKVLQKAYADQKSEMKYMETQLQKLSVIIGLRREEQSLSSRLTEVIAALEDYTKDGNPVFDKIARKFHELAKRVLGLTGLFFIRQNASGNLEFKIQTERADSSGEVTGQSKGTSYRKLLCALFDLSVLSEYQNQDFYHFVYHDGILEGLDDRKRLKLIDVIREHAVPGGIQYILTVIDADLPRVNNEQLKFAEDEIVLHLHDDGEQGRLFKMREF